jgi:hypothetical protein
MLNSATTITGKTQTERWSISAEIKPEVKLADGLVSVSAVSVGSGYSNTTGYYNETKTVESSTLTNTAN